MFSSPGESGDFDVKTFLTKPQVILRISGWVSRYRYYFVNILCSKSCVKNTEKETETEKSHYLWVNGWLATWRAGQIELPPGK